MIYTVRFVKTSDAFPNKFDLYAEEDGMRKKVGDYRNGMFPGSKIFYRPKYKHSGASKGFLVNLTERELNKIVKEIGLTREDGTPIEKADKRNIFDPFFNHPELRFEIEGGVANLNDEIPFDRFFLACFEADPRCVVYKTSEDLFNNVSYGQFTEIAVMRMTEDDPDERRKRSKKYRAMEIFINMPHEKRIDMLYAMGVLFNADEVTQDQVKDLLFRKITDDAYKTSPAHGMTNLDLFLALAEMRESEFYMNVLINKAIQRKIIKRSLKEGYKYKDILLGKTKKEIMAFLRDEENAELFKKIVKDVESKKVSV